MTTGRSQVIFKSVNVYKREGETREFTPRQKEIIGKAVGIIAREGIQGLTIKNLAQAVHVTEAALYRHFKNKQAILSAIIERFVVVSRVPPHPDPRGEALEIIELFLMDRFETFSADPDLAKVMLSEEIFIHNEFMATKQRTVMHGHREFVVKAIETGQKSGRIRRDIDPASLFRIIVGSMRLLVTQWSFNNFTFDLKREGRRLWQTIRSLIQTKPEEE
ncbi:MAG TPA: TetR/AcrR family transcriptional regulator [Candidatus Aminicenantes bacterium]|nr:TetR/AcrR family transcriptional regulator [Candidatus Aminicenantes bacterium]